MRHVGKLVAISCIALWLGCSSDSKSNGHLLPDGAVDTAADGGTSGNAGSGSGAGNGGLGSNEDGGVLGIPDPSWVVPPELQLCDGPCACADGMDNDGDGTADGFDTECTGPSDDDEGSFATGISGDNVDPKWQDCFFDGNSGAGNDGCRYSTKCLTGELPQTDEDCTLAKNCVEYCKPRAPNGCDCFGCCEVRDDDGKTYNVVLTSTCDSSDLAACTQCVPSTQCGNTCGECELCPGKTPADLPAKCSQTPTGGAGTSGGTAGTTGGGAGSGSTEPPPNYTCDNGETVCRSNSDCGAGEYCGFGCCLVLPPI